MSLQTASIAQNCKVLRLPSVGAQFASLAEEAGQRNHSHLHYSKLCSRRRWKTGNDAASS